MARGLIAGALGGLGEGAMQAGRQLGDYASRSAIQSEAAAIQKERDARLEEFASAREIRQDTRADTRLDKTLGATASEGKLGREHSTELAKITDTRIKEEGKAGRDLTREQIASHERLAGATNARISAEAKLNREQQLNMHTERMTELKEQFKNQGLSIQNTTSGIVIVDAKNGKSTPVLDAEGKPLKTLNQDDSFKVLGALGNLAKAAADSGNTETSKMYLDMASKVLSGKGGEGDAKKPKIVDPFAAKQPGVVGAAAEVKGEDIGYSATNPDQFKHVLNNMRSQPSLKAQAKFWLDSNQLDLQKKQQIQRALGR